MLSAPLVDTDADTDGCTYVTFVPCRFASLGDDSAMAAMCRTPQSCTPDVNQKLAELLAQHTTENVDNVMVVR